MADVGVMTNTGASTLVRSTNVVAKAGLLVLLLLALVYPDLGNLRGKAANARAIAYPLLAFSIPIAWWTLGKPRSAFPWSSDLLVTITCFTDILGNRLDLYDTVVWFDDWMHFMNTGFLAAAVIMLTMHRAATLPAMLERALAFGVTAAVGWEIAEYFAFLSRSNERYGAYADTLGDLTLGSLGSVVAAFLIHACWRRRQRWQTTPYAPLAGATPPRHPV